MKNIITMSRNKAALFESKEPWAAIQIATYQDWWPPLKKENRKGLWRTFFDDRDVIEEGVNLFKVEQADEILDYVDGIKDEIDTLLVHCEAGVSRSTGMAAALHRVYFGNDGKWFETTSPNRRVYRVMLERAFEKGLYKVEDRIEVPESKDLSWDNDPSF